MSKYTLDEITAAFAAMPASRSIPTVPGNPNYSIRTRLDGRDFGLSFLWNERADIWSMSITEDSDGGAPLLSGVKLVTNWPLLRFYQYDDRLPIGEMMAIDSTGDGSPAGINELGIGLRVTLVYFPLTDL